MESVDRDDIIADNDIENKQPVVVCNTSEICSKPYSYSSEIQCFDMHRSLLLEINADSLEGFCRFALIFILKNWKGNLKDWKMV